MRKNNDYIRMIAKVFPVKRLLLLLTIMVVFVFGGFAIQVNAADIEESAMENATEIQFDTEYSIAWSRDNSLDDYYNKFILDEDGIVSLSVDTTEVFWNSNHTPICPNVNIKIFDESGNKINDITTTFTVSSFLPYEYSVALSKGVYYMDIGLYVLDIPLGGCETSTTYTLSYSNETQYIEKEPNDEKETATRIQSDIEYTATLGDNLILSTDWYEMDLVAGKKVTLYIGNYDELVKINPLWLIYNENEEAVMSNQSFVPQLEDGVYNMGSFTPTESGKYYFYIFTISARSYSIEYTVRYTQLETEDASDSEYFDNKENEEVSDVIETDNEDDVYTIKREKQDDIIYINILKNPIKIKYSKLKKKTQKVEGIEVLFAEGKVIYSKVSGTKKISVNKNNAKITVKKGLKKGKYKMKIKVKAKGNNYYYPYEKIVTLNIYITS